MDYTIKIGGEAGQGIQTIGETLGRVFARSGYHVFTNQDYESRVRGGHNFYQIRFSDRPVMAPKDAVDIIVALDKESIRLHEQELTQRGQIIYDADTLKEKHDKQAFLDIPFVKLATEHGGDKIMANTVATGAVLGMLGMELDILLGIIADTFRKKGEKIVTANKNAALAGYDYAVKGCLSMQLRCCLRREGRAAHAGRRDRGHRPGRHGVGGKVLLGLSHDAVHGHHELSREQGKGIRHGRGAGRGRDRGHQHGAGRIVRGRPRHDRHVGRRLRPDGRGRCPSPP